VETRLEPVAPKRNAYQQEVKERGWYEYFFVWARLRNREGLGNQNKIAGRPIIRRPGWFCMRGQQEQRMSCMKMDPGRGF
jgi:hypothetical protein